MAWQKFTYCCHRPSRLKRAGVNFLVGNTRQIFFVLGAALPTQQRYFELGKLWTINSPELFVKCGFHESEARLILITTLISPARKNKDLKCTCNPIHWQLSGAVTFTLVTHVPLACSSFLTASGNLSLVTAPLKLPQTTPADVHTPRITLTKRRVAVVDCDTDAVG